LHRLRTLCIGIITVIIIIIIIIIRLHRSTMHEMQPTVTDRVVWSVGQSVCLSVCQSVGKSY